MGTRVVGRITSHPGGFLGLGVLLLVLLLGAAVSALAGEGDPPAPGPAGLSGEDREKLEEGKRKRAQERERRRRDPRARAERQRSRVAHIDEALDSGEAADLVERSFGEELLTSPGDEPLAGPGERVERFLSDYAALIESDRGRARIAEDPFTVLRSEDGHPLDLGLEERSEGFSPEHGGAALRLPKRLSDGIEFGDSGVRLRAVGPKDSDPEGRKRGEGVVWPKAWKDADLFAVPNSAGAQVNIAVRSERAAESYALKAELPDGARLKALDGGERGARVIGRDGERLAELSPPLARDSDGEEVPTSMRVDDDRIVLRVEHRDKDVRFPVALDPLYTDYTWYEGTDRANPNANWEHRSSNDNRFSFTVEEDFGTCYRSPTSASSDCRGLYIFSSDNTNYSTGEYGWWEWTIPGATSYLERVDFQSMALSHRGESSPSPDLYAGIFSFPYNRWIGYRNWPSGFGPSSQTVTAGQNVNAGPYAQSGKSALFMLYFDDAGHRDDRVHAYLGGARMYMNDPENPTLGALGHDGQPFPTGWTKETFPRLSVAATDPGLGVKSVFLRRPSGEESERRVASPAGGDCQGTRQVPCPAAATATFDYASSEQREGIHTFATRALDALGKATPTREHQLKIDRTAPAVTSTGTLKDANGTKLRSDRVLALRTEARDEDPAGPRAGVGRIEVQVDGKPQGTAPTCNADSCPLTRDFSLDTATLPEGRHEVRVLVPDRAGNERAETYSFEIDRPGEYIVTSCDYAPGHVNNAWVATRTGSDYQTSRACPSNGATQGGLGLYTNRSGTGSPGVGAFWTFTAAPGTTLRSMDYRLAGRDKGNVEVNLLGAGTLFHTDSTSYVVAERLAAPLGGSTSARLRTLCDTSSTRCNYDLEYGDIFLHGSRVTVADPQLPAVALTGGSIPTRTWQRGEADLIANLTDNVGAREGRLLLDGAERERRAFACDYTFAKPCQSRTGERFTLDTTALPDGTEHTARVATEDASGHEAFAERAFKVDNAGPMIETSGPLAEPGWKGRGPHELTVDARDGDAQNSRSGTSKIETFVNGAQSARHTVSAPPGCTDSCRITQTLRFEESDLREGENTVAVRATDHAGNVSTRTLTVRVDRGDPSVTTSGPMHDAQGRWLSPLSPLDLTLSAEARDESTSGPRSGVARIRTRVNDATDAQGQPAYKHNVPNAGCSGDSCSQSAGPLAFQESDFRDGVNRVRVEALDGASPAGAGSRDVAVRLDRAAPTLALSGTLYDRRDGVLADGTYQLVAAGRDGDAQSPSSGMRELEVLVDGQLKEPAVPSSQDCPAGNCTLSRTLTFDTAQYLPGPHVITVRGEDQVGNPVQSSFRVINRTALFEPEAKLGLEQWWQYESTDTGAGTQAHVNVATGNLVWHSTPINNPGRGLSSVLNLTYNAQGPVGDELLGYGQAGKGFSLGASGLTRVNEPLDLHREAAGVVEFNDLDGTRHRFDRASDGRWRSSPGLNLEFRRFSETNAARTYAATRPDGVTHFFDARGYQTGVEDRNGNVLRFEYEQVLAAGGVACPTAVAETPLADVACKPRLKRVTDSAGVLDGAPNRSLDFSYYTAQELDLGGLDRIKEITDHGGRRLRLDYDPLGYLKKMTQAHGTDDARSFEFDYELLGVGLGGLDRNLSAVKDPNGRQTELTYKLDPLDALPASPAFLGKRVETVTDRREEGREAHTDRFTYRRGDGALAAAPNEMTKKDARGFDTVYRSDADARMVERVDARGTRTLQEWDSDNNNTKLTEAAGSADQAVTQMKYDGEGGDGNGLLTEQVNPEGHKTVLEYEHSAGTSGLRAESGDDEGGEFVADLVSITNPNGFAGADPDNHKTVFELDERGNQISRQDPGVSETAKTTFALDGPARGEVIREEDQVGNVTEYPASDYDPNGMARTKVDPRQGRWRYTYDAVGNLLTATDPRGGSGERFRTTLTYDALDQMTRERKPKDSAAGDFIERTMQYDDNGNVTAKVDGEGARAETDYTATDKPKEMRSPPAPHIGPSGAEEGAASEVTRRTYDAEENLIEEERPEGTRTGTDDDFSTLLSYDEVGQRLTETRRSRGGSEPAKDLVTSWSYDRRGNMVGMSDPRHNTSGDPVANARTSGGQRFAYTYDKANRRTDQVEDPGGRALRTRTTYDANGNRTSVIDPRGFETGASQGAFKTTWLYDARDHVVEQIDPAGKRTLSTYRPDGKLETETSPRGAETTGDDSDFKTAYEYWPTGELKSKTLPRAPDQYGPVLKVSYEALDGVGNPTRIRDARGNAFTNTFYDTGDLKTTERPSWWGYRREAGEEEADDGQGEEGETPQEIVERGPRPDEGKGDGLPSSEGEGDFGEVKGQQKPGLLPKAGKTEFAYDDEMRLEEVKSKPPGLEQLASTVTHDPLGRATEVTKPLDVNSGSGGTDRYIIERYAYDRHGNTRQQIDAEGNKTTTEFDQFDRPVRETRPGSAREADGSDNVAKPDEVTLTRYDENGNATAVQTPRGTEEAEASGANAFAKLTEYRTYDALDRMIEQKNPAGERTTYAHDGAGNVTLERRPKGNQPSSADDRYATRYRYDGRNLLESETDGAGQATTYRYDANANQTRVEAPGAASTPSSGSEPRITETTYDGRDLPWAKTTAPGTGQRTTVTEYDGNGNLRREVKPVGVDEATRRASVADDGGPVGAGSPVTKQATVHEYSPDDLLLTRHLPWGERDAGDRERYRQDFHRDARGWVTEVDSIAKEGEPPAKTRYSHFDSGWIKTQEDPTLPAAAPGGQPYEQTMTYDYDARGLQKLWKSSNSREMRRSYFPSGQLRTRQAEEPNGQGGVRTRTYYFGYNANRSRSEMRDEDLNRTTELHYDAAERETLVDERWGPSGDLPAGRDTVTEYDADGNATSRRTDGIATVSGNGTLSSYDGGKRTSYAYDVLDRESTMTVAQAGQPSRTTETTYHPSGEVAERTKPSGVREQTYFDAHGELSETVRGRPGQTPVKDQAYAYDRDGNRTKDERGTYAYNARDQLTAWTQPGGSSPYATYELNGSGAVTRQVEAGVAETRTYRGDQLTSTRRGTTTTRFEYDSYGNMSEEWTQVDGEPAPAEPDTSYRYDAFERLNCTGSGTASQSSECKGTDVTYSYDGLDRRDYRKEGQTRYDSSYVGQSEALSREEDQGGKTQLYDYDSAGDTQGQATIAGGSTGYHSFAKDANGSVEGLEDANGAVPVSMRYGYDPYGKTTTEPTDQAAKDNPIRFEGFRRDPATDLYDMGARMYRPDVGRFLTQDRFESSAGDFSLQSDPLTQNRYAFAGGNPVSRVEWDGHQTFRGCRTTQRGGVTACPGPRGRQRNNLRVGVSVGVFDSFGRRIATVRRTGRTSFRLSQPGAAPIPITRRRGLIFVNEGACQPRRHGRATAFASIDLSLRRGADPRLQVRGFINPRNLERPRDLGGRRRCARAQGSPTDPGPLPFRNPGFHPQDRYDRRGDNPEAADRYGFYGPRPSGAIPLSASPTSFDRGGVPVGVVNADDHFVRTGFFTNCDSNSLQNDENMGHVPDVSWSHGYVERGGRKIWGWVPTQALVTPENEPPLTGCKP